MRLPGALWMTLIMVPVAAATKPVTAPSPALIDYNRQRLQRGTNAMTALTIWSGANIIAGAIGWPLADGDRWTAFHASNLSWGVVNLAIALPSLIRHVEADPAELGLAGTLKAEHGLETALLFNLGLDVAYVASGALLWERGDSGNKPVLSGVGQSMIGQGAFLFAFDLIYYLTTANDSVHLYSAINGDGFRVGLATHF